MTFSARPAVAITMPDTNEREDKFDFLFPRWSRELIASVIHATDCFALTDMATRHYRSYVMDTPDRRLAKVGFELRRRPTLVFNADPNLRIAVPGTNALCLKSKRQLKNRIECEAPWNDADVKGSYRNFDEHYNGFVSSVFREAGIRNPAEEIGDLAIGDVTRQYRELELYMTRSGHLAHDPYNKHDRRIILALCLDSLEVLGQHPEGFLSVTALLSQLELENKNKKCPYEAQNATLTDPRATDIQIEGAFAEVHDTWQPIMARRHVPYTPSRLSKTSFIDEQTQRWLTGLTQPKFKIAA